MNDRVAPNLEPPHSVFGRLIGHGQSLNGGNPLPTRRAYRLSDLPPSELIRQPRYCDPAAQACECDDAVVSDEFFTDDDARDLARLLAKYAMHELDQFDHWIVETSFGPVYIEIANERPKDGRSAALYQTIWPLPPRLDPAAPRQSSWIVYQFARGARSEVGRFGSRREAESRVVALEAETGLTYWISHPVS